MRILSAVTAFLGLVIFSSQAANALGFDPGEALDRGGHLRLRGSVSDPEAGSRLSVSGRERLHDGSFEFRSKHDLSLEPGFSGKLHYEMIGITGETRGANARFLEGYPVTERLLFITSPTDERRLMDLTHVISDRTDTLVYHRIDRLYISVRRDWGAARLGRQAITWGNGFLFHPMDLFNPFSPTDVERDYKVGDDMANFQVYTGAAGEVQLLGVPRRNPADGDIAWDHSSLAAKFHTSLGSLEMDAMAAAHYDDAVFGVGLVGYAGSAAWRLDATYTMLDEKYDRTGFASICANMDYSWVAWGRNMYGWIEYFYTGLGASDYERIWTDAALVDRLVRGERFTLGRSYLDANLQAEFHPLVNGYLTCITNLRDPSGALQPRLVWEARQNLEITAGANLYFGGVDTEFGGFAFPGLPVKEAPADTIYLWASLFY